MNLVELFLDPAAFAQYCRERGLRAAQVVADPGYAVHAWLAEAFGAETLRPFRVMATRPRVRILGYSRKSQDELREIMNLNAVPSVAAVLASPVLSKPMPSVFPAGRRLGFELESVVVTRNGKTGEKDAFLAALDAHGDSTPERYEVYRNWLANRIGGAADIAQCDVAAFKLCSLVRKDEAQTQGGRAQRTITRPRAVFRGVLTVKDSTAFQELLERGVGRGKGLGFGMLLLLRAA